MSALDGIEHIVVVMMENRSFDHMLGYLHTDGMPEVNGLRGNEFNLGPDGEPVPLTAFHADAHDIMREGEALQKRLDPDHSKDSVAIQIGHGYSGTDPMKGFVQAFVETRMPADDVEQALWVVPMGHYTGADLPVYDHLARTFCVCDAWHASVPGDTWPNRMFALAGREQDRHPNVLQRLVGHLPLPALRSLANAPIFEVEAFTRQLADGQWRWYSHDPATLRAVDAHYRRFDHPMHENFAFFDRNRVQWLTRELEAPLVSSDSFLDDAAAGRLRDVSWIDPNFIDLSVLDPASTDDHPPSDIRAGQAFVLEVYEALRRGPAWEDTLLVVVYDEHGGFFDHEPPPDVAADDDTGYATLGVRVPALLVGPRVRQGVCHDVFDHTSLIKTILTRFAADPDRALAAMPARVRGARDLGSALLSAPRSDVAPSDGARAAIDAWRSRAAGARRGGAGGAAAAADGAGRATVMHDFQEEWVRFALAMRHAGLPAGHP